MTEESKKMAHLLNLYTEEMARATLKVQIEYLMREAMGRVSSDNNFDADRIEECVLDLWED